MIDLHLHLDGSLSEEDFCLLAKKEKYDLSFDFPNNIYVPDDCPSLEEYLKRFDIPLALLQNEENIVYSVESLIDRLANQGFVYAEIRFAPQLHTLKGLSQTAVVKAAIKGLKNALKRNSEMDANLILCCMRHGDEKTNLETVKVAKKFVHNKVCAVDLAGAEALHPSSYYAKIFNKAKKYHLNITIHAGEATGSDEILMALNNGAMRIGHGVHLSLDEKTVKTVKEKNICFEFCPTSNLQTKSLIKYSDCPLKLFMELNIPVTINSDNMTVSNTDAIKEMKHMMDVFDLSKEEIYSLLENSVEHAFISKNNKKKLRKKIDEKFPEYYEKLKH